MHVSAPVLGWGSFVKKLQGRLQHPGDTAKLLSCASTLWWSHIVVCPNRCTHPWWCCFLCCDISVSAVFLAFLEDLFFFLLLNSVLRASVRQMTASSVCEGGREIRESPKDNKASGWERVPFFFFFSSLACCFLLYLALSQRSKCGDTDIFKCAGFAGARNRAMLTPCVFFFSSFFVWLNRFRTTP